MKNADHPPGVPKCHVDGVRLLYSFYSPALTARLAPLSTVIPLATTSIGLHASALCLTLLFLVPLGLFFSFLLDPCLCKVCVKRLGSPPRLHLTSSATTRRGKSVNVVDNQDVSMRR
jgi:hypothetical protein